MNKKERRKKMLEEIYILIGSFIYLCAGIGTMVFTGWLWLLFQMTGLEMNIPLLVMPVVAGFASIGLYFEILSYLEKKNKVKK